MKNKKISNLLKNNLNEQFITYFFKNEELDESILEKYIGYFDELYQFERIVSNEVPEDWWIEFVENEFDIQYLWTLISEYQILSELFIEKHSEEVNWSAISIYQKLSEGFIERHYKEVDWDYISKYQKLSESFIERYSKKVEWISISKYQILSEEFIEKHFDKVNRYSILKYQNISEKFKTIMRNKLK